MKRRAILFFLLFLLQMGSVPTLAAEPTVVEKFVETETVRRAQH